MVVSRTLDATATRFGAQRAQQIAQAPPAVAVQDLSKAFRLPHQRYSTLKERALHPFAARTHDVLQALDNVSFEVKRGEFFGIVGRNGSGKSTLLKCLAGIYAMDEGVIDVRGRLSPFIELGVGFNPDLTARDNVVINAIMLGLSRKEARRRFDDIIAFAELEEFVDLKLKNYSSGMAVRLGFSVAVQVDADVLLVDEVLAVGDASFQRKCFEEFERMRGEGRTILFVTHDMGSVERFCDRAMLLEHGEVLDLGPPDEIARRYNEVNFGKVVEEGSLPAGMYGSDVRVRTVWCEDSAGERIVAQQRGERCVAVIDVEFTRALENPVFAVVFRNDVRLTVFVATSLLHGQTGRFEAGERVNVRFSFDNRLAPSRYTLTPTIGVWDPDYRQLDRKEDVSTLIVDSVMHTGGVVDIPTQLEVTRQ
ncbi:MAG: ABC transporter ATP-binding protein [Actinobacteria bacterium]|nr:ABC transporter ATP-binding protein [Actinomycetota bacterium]